MEPRAKRPRLHRAELGHTSHLTDIALDYDHHGQPSNSFEGCGVQNTGSLAAGRDLVINISKQSNADFEVGKIQNLMNNRRILLESLRFDQMDARESSIKKAHERTCAWFLNTSEYVSWVQANNGQSFLWIRGKPGAGKSTLMKYILGQLRRQTNQSASEEVILAFFFNARGNELGKSTAGLYRSLLLQLFEARTDIQSVLDKIQIGHRWTIESLKTILEEAIQAASGTSFICLIDALDECGEAQIRDMISFLSDLSITQNRFRTCFASRHYPHISIKMGLGIVLEAQTGHGKDIASYVASRLIIQNQSLATRIHQDLLTKAAGVFMWVVLVVSILNKEHDAGNEHLLHERIQQFPDGLQDLFFGILTRDGSNSNGLLLCIQWVLFAPPLKLKEMYFAVISGIEPHNLARCHSSNITEDAMKRYILSMSKGLAEPTVSITPTIQFIHESVRDFLLKENGLIRIWPSLAANFVGRSHDMLKECCLTYIRMDQVSRMQDPPRQPIYDAFPFLLYANRRILDHAEQAQQHGINQGDFLTTFPHSKWVKIRKEIDLVYYHSEVSLLYILIKANKPALIRAHPNRQSSFEIESEGYRVPLLAAFASGNEAVIQTLMDLEADRLPESPFATQYRFMPDEPYPCSVRHTPFKGEQGLLQHIIQYGTEKISLLYLATEPNYDINAKGVDGRAILNYAVEQGHYMLSRALLLSGADISIADDFGQTPLHIALWTGETELAMLLIDHGANISAVDKLGQTPLHISSFQRDIDMTTVLLEQGASVLVTDSFGQTPLDIVLSEWNRGMLQRIDSGFTETAELAQLLIDHGANVSAASDEGQTLIDQFKVDRYILKPLLSRGA